MITTLSSEKLEKTTEQHFVNALEVILQRLQRNHVPFCLLRNRDLIPTGLLEGSDIDLVVPNNVSSEDLWRIFRDLRPQHTVRHRSPTIFYFPVGSVFLRVDFIHRDQEWLGATYLRNDDILNGVWVDGGIPVASELHQAFDAWATNLLWNGKFKPRYQDLVIRVAHHQSAQFKALFCDTFGPRLAEDIWSCIGTGHPELTTKLSHRCRRALWLRGIKRQPLSTLRGVSGYIARRVGFRLHPPGISVAILGPDGSGKSTICERLSIEVSPHLPFAGITYHHLYRPFLPQLADIRHGQFRRPTNAVSSINTEPQGKAVHGPFLSTLRMTYFLVNQWLSELAWGRHEIARNKLRLHDRHMLELVVDPVRYRFGGPIRLGRLFSRLAPQPDIVIYLDASTDVLQQRKQEVSPRETERQRGAYRDLVRDMKRGHIVDASGSVDRITDEIKNIIVQELAIRTQRRFGNGSRR